VGLVLMGSPFSQTAQTLLCTQRVPLSVVLVHQHDWGLVAYSEIPQSQSPCVLSLQKKRSPKTPQTN
jgi:hypothetical protein